MICCGICGSVCYIAVCAIRLTDLSDHGPVKENYL